MPLVGLFSIVCVFCMHQSSLLRIVCLYLATISIVFALYMHQSFSFLSLICLDLNLLSVAFAIYIATKLFCTHLIHLVRATFPIEYAFYIHQSSLFHLDEFSWPRSLLNMTSVCIIAILPLLGTISIVFALYMYQSSFVPLIRLLLATVSSVLLCYVHRSSFLPLRCL